MPPLRQVPEDISSLTDLELADQLRLFNVVLGPILPTTRKVYERKLYELRTGSKASPSTHFQPVDDDDEEDMEQDSGDEEVVLQQHQPRQRTTRSMKSDATSTPPRKADSPPRKADSPSRRPATSHLSKANTRTSTAAASASHTSQKQSCPPAKGLPAWVKLLAIVIIASLVFLVIKNMESDPVAGAPELEIDV